MQMRTLLVVIGICMSTPALIAQDVAEVRARFESPDAIRWTHSYRGYWQHVHPLEIILAYDGNTYHGSMQIGKTGLQFDLEGYHDAEKGIVLQEIEPGGRTSGYLLVSIAEGRMTGHWWSTDFTRAAIIALRSDEVIELRRFEPELLVFDGNAGSQQVRATIQREESDLLSGVCTIGAGEYLYRINGSCDDPGCDRMTLSVFAPAGQIYDLRLTRQRGSVFRLHLQETERGIATEGTSTIAYRYPMQRVTYTSFTGSIDGIYPVTAVPALDSWILSRVNTWNAEVRRHLDSLETALEKPGPLERMRVQASAWIDFTLFTTQVASGILTRYDPGQQKYMREAFTYDLKSGKPVSVQELSRKNQFADDLIDDAADLKEAGMAESEYLAWLDDQTLRHVALSPVGFVLFTDFDVRFGDTWVTLPYRHYAHVLRRNAFVFDLDHIR